MSIQEHLNKIRNAVYGHEVRESIAKGIETAYDDASEKDNANMEVKIARGTHPNLRSRLDETTAQLQQKAERDTVFSMANMGQDIKTAMTGGSVAVVGVDSTLSENIVDGQVKPRNTSFMSASENLLNVNALVVGTVSTSNGTFNVADTGYRRSLYMKVTPSTEYKLKFRFNVYFVGLRYAWYDANYTFISGANFASANITAPANAHFIVVCFAVDANGYYGYFFGKATDSFCIYGDEVLKDEYINTDNRVIKKASNNLYNYLTVNTGKTISSNVATHGLTFEEILALPNTVNSGYYQSALIQVEYGKMYSFWIGLAGGTWNIFRLSEFDKNHRFIGYAENVHEYTPTNKHVKYISFASQNGFAPNSHVFVEGVTFTFYSTYAEQITLDGQPVITEVTLDWKGKKYCSYGDSLTQFGFWQKAVTDYHKFGTHYKRGLSGAKISSVDSHGWWVNPDGSIYGSVFDNPTQPEGTTLVSDSYCSADRIATVPVDSDLVLIMGGTNDFYSNIPIGDMVYNAGYNEATFKGALASTIAKMIARAPNAVICVMTLLNGQGTTLNNDGTYRVNSLGLTARDYAVATRDVCDFLGIPVIDVFGKSGINSWNRQQYIKTDMTHNTYNILNSGADQIARTVIGELKTIIPHFTKIVYDVNN